MTNSTHPHRPHDPEPGDLPVEPDEGPAPAGIPVNPDQPDVDDPAA